MASDPPLPDRNERENPSNANRYAAAILRDLDDRIDRLENAVSAEGVPNVLRTATEDVIITEAVTVTTTTSSPALRWDDQSGNLSTWDDTGESWA